jgi:hypothetical protein
VLDAIAVSLNWRTQIDHVQSHMMMIVLSLVVSVQDWVRNMKLCGDVVRRPSKVMAIWDHPMGGAMKANIR